jgi:PAS domain S-box-containing protein
MGIGHRRSTCASMARRKSGFGQGDSMQTTRLTPPAPVEKVTRWGCHALTGLLRLWGTLSSGEASLREVLATSLDAIVVTSRDHRFITANPKALELFGISGANVQVFTLDLFMSSDTLSDFDAASSPFLTRAERLGTCNIRRLDGTLRTAEYAFVSNFVPHRHLSRFRTVSPNRAQFGCIASKIRDLRVWQASTASPSGLA